jgi:glucose 1-dehydrogenase
MTQRLQDKVALITGSDSGIGQATAIEFAREGADVVVHYLDDEDGAGRTRAEVEAVGRRAVVVQADITDEAQVDRLFEAATETFGTVDILMNNAGVDASGAEVADLSTDVFDHALRANLYGAFFCCRRYIGLRPADLEARSSTSPRCIRRSPTPAGPTTTARRERCATSPMCSRSSWRRCGST